MIVRRTVIISFFSQEDRALIDECRAGTIEYRQETLRRLELLLEYMVDEKERKRLSRLVRIIGEQGKEESRF